MKYLVFVGLFLVTCLAGLGILVFQLNNRINNSLEKGWFTPPIEFYTNKETLRLGAKDSPKNIERKLKQRYYIKITDEKNSLKPGYFLHKKNTECENLDSRFRKGSATLADKDSRLRGGTASLAEKGTASLADRDSRLRGNDKTRGNDKARGNDKTRGNDITYDHCFFWQDAESKELFSLGFLDNTIQLLQKDQQKTDSLILKPFLFAQYEEGEPILKKFTALNQFPFYCLQSVLSAEDHRFILHEGVSLKAIIRATWRNLRAGRLAEGGSTITQQLVKNIFFSQKKSFKRKFQEQIMALLLETKLTKDEILTAYLNIVYMGQRGVFRIYGFGSAAEHYIGKSISFLNLSECAFLAGLIKSPGQYNSNKKQVLKRRNYILNTLYEKQSISLQEKSKALSQKLPTHTHQMPNGVYFTDAVYKKILQLNLPVQNGLKVFTTQQWDLQNKAEKSVAKELKRLDKVLPARELAPPARDTDPADPSARDENSNKVSSARELAPPLQSALVHVDNKTGEVLALVGGRDFKKSQFNRAVQAKRQIGSLIKPVVVLSALIENPKLHPLSLIEDKRFNYKYDSLEWSPKNYKNRYMGLVPLYKLLTFSLNAGTAQLGIQTGLSSLVQTIEKLGGPKNLSPHPALTLGALELSPWEIAQIFLTIARLGTYKKMHIIKKVANLEGDVLYEHKELDKLLGKKRDAQVVDEKKTAVLIGMLREVTRSGTGRRLKSFPVPVAGKTGTTNDEKDAWFVGFTPLSLTVVWTGFDDNRSHHLTGASGALPLWESFTRKTRLPTEENFSLPAGVIEKPLPTKEEDSDTPINLFFEK